MRIVDSVSADSAALCDDYGCYEKFQTGICYGSLDFSLGNKLYHGICDPPQPGCTASTTNTGSCDHTSIATQTKGTGIN